LTKVFEAGDRGGREKGNEQRREVGGQARGSKVNDNRGQSGAWARNSGEWKGNQNDEYVKKIENSEERAENPCRAEKGIRPCHNIPHKWEGRPTGFRQNTWGAFPLFRVRLATLLFMR